MMINGRAIVLPMDDVSTDHIYPSPYGNLTDPKEIGEHALEGADRSIRERLQTVGNILVTGKNFGAGSSREHAVITLKEAGVKAVIANSVARIWFRNSINLALPVLICPGLVDCVTEGDELDVDFAKGLVKNITQNTIHQGQPVSEFALNIIQSGGIKPLMRKKHCG